MNTALNRTMVALLTNQSGGSVAQGDVVVVDSANASSFTTNTAGAYVSGSTGVVLEPNGIAAAATGTVALGGWVPKVNLSGAASLGDVFKTHTVAKQAVRHAAPVVAGDFGEVLGTGTSPAAYLWSAPNQGGGAGSSILAGDTDVSIVTPANLDLLQYSTSDSKWHNVANRGVLTLISSQVLAVAAASMTFSSIPGTYKDLIFALMVRSDAASATPQARFNGDTAADYDYQQSWSNASTVGASSTAALTSMSFSAMAVSGSLAGAFTQIEGRIVGYASTSFQKISQSRTSQFAAAGVGNVTNSFDMNRWNNTAAITSITFLPSAGNFIAGCQLTLWGVN